MEYYHITFYFHVKSVTNLLSKANPPLFVSLPYYAIASAM